VSVALIVRACNEDANGKEKKTKRKSAEMKKNNT